METRVDGAKASLVLDPTIDMSEEPHYYIEKAGSYVRYYQDKTKNSSTSSVSFSVVPPSKDIAIDKHIYIECDAKITVDWTSNGAAPPVYSDPLGSIYEPTSNTLNDAGTAGGLTRYLGGDNCALRWMPFQNCCNTVQIAFNDQSISLQMSDFIDALGRFGNSKDEQNHELSTAPSMNDVYTNLQDYQRWGDTFNPFATYGANPAQLARGGHKIRVVWLDGAGAETDVEADARKSVLYARWREPLMISPLLFGRRVNEKGFVGITNLDFVFNMGDLRRMLTQVSRAVNAVDGNEPSTAEKRLANVTVEWNQDPQLSLRYVTPPAGEIIPYVNQYPYYRVNRYPTDIGAVAGGTASEVSMNNVQLSSVPKRLYLYIRESNASRTSLTNRRLWESADSYCKITGINVQFMNEAGLLASATDFDLFEMSQRNGLKENWVQWSEMGGGVVCVDFSRDIGICEPDKAVGSRGQFQCQVKINYVNNLRYPVPLTAYMVVVEEGIMTVEGTSTSISVGSVLAQNVLQATQLSALERVPYYEANNEFYGGSFMGFLRRVGRKIKSGAKAAMPYIKKGLEFAGPALEAMAPTAAPLIREGVSLADKLLGAGYSEEQVRQMLSQKPARGGLMTGAGLVSGGAVASKRTLKKKM